jgi:hypothetical protein
MIIANIQESSNSTIVPLYYKVIRSFQRYTISVVSFGLNSGVAAYAVITELVSDIAHI